MSPDVFSLLDILQLSGVVLPRPLHWYEGIFEIFCCNSNGVKCLNEVLIQHHEPVTQRVAQERPQVTTLGWVATMTQGRRSDFGFKCGFFLHY